MASQRDSLRRLRPAQRRVAREARMTSTVTTVDGTKLQIAASRGGLASLGIGAGKIALDATDARALASALLAVATMLG